MFGSALILSSCIAHSFIGIPFNTTGGSQNDNVPSDNQNNNTPTPGPTELSHFGLVGMITKDMSQPGYAYAVAVQADGKIIAAGATFNGISDMFTLIRYNIDGSLDTTFGTGGIVTSGFGSGSIATAVAVQTDGKIVAAGTAASGFINSGSDFVLARYNDDGSYDTSFGDAGMVVTHISEYDDEVNAMALQTDGKIVVAGTVANGRQWLFALARYNADGSSDTLFGTAGLVTTDINGSQDRAYAVAIDAKGRIVAAGYSDDASVYVYGSSFALVRYKADGSLDTGFGSGGIVTSGFGSNSEAKAVAIQTNGKIVAAGYAEINGSNDFTVVRYNTDGSNDTTFGRCSDLICASTTDFSGGDDEATAMSIQTDGRIVVAGYSYNGNDYDFALVRYKTDGSLDTSFGTGGKITTDIDSGLDDEANAMAIQADGRIVAVGYSYSGGYAGNIFSLARYNTDGSLHRVAKSMLPWWGAASNTPTDITVDFTGVISIDCSSVNASSLTVQTQGGTPVTGTVICASDRITFTPDNAFEQYTEYVVTLSGVTEAITGKSFTSFTWFFTPPGPPAC